MGVRARLVCGVFSSLLGGALATVLVAIILSFTAFPNWTASVDSFLTTEDQSTIILVSKQQSQYMETFFAHMIADLRSVASFAKNLFFGGMNYTALPSYFGVTSVDPTQPPSKLLSSVWFKLGVTNLAALSPDERAQVDHTSVLDVAWKSLYASNRQDIYTSLYIGMDDSGMYRSYPWKRVEGYPTVLMNPCYRDGLVKPGYDPRCRAWYHMANQQHDLILAPPYLDAAGAGLVITSAIPIMDPTTTLLHSVVAADCSIQTLKDLVAGTTIHRSGYAYVIDTQGNAIIHRSLSSYSGTTSILDLEFTTVERDVTFTSKILPDMRALKTGTGTFVRDHVTWYISYAPIPSARMAYAVVVPMPEVLQAADNAKAAITTSFGVMIAVLVVIVTVAVIVVLIVAWSNANAIVEPVNKLTSFLASYNKDRSFSQMEAGEMGSTEITALFGKFKHMITGLRFANSSFSSGRLDEAEKTYMDARKMFEEMNNLKGVAVCNNNLSSVLARTNRIPEAIALSNKAIQAVETDIQDPNTPKNRLRENQIIRASRYFNRGRAQMDGSLFAEALQSMTICLDAARSLEAWLSFLRFASATCELHVKMGHPEQADALLSEMAEIDNLLQGATTDRDQNRIEEGDKNFAHQLLLFTQAQIVKHTRQPIDAYPFLVECLEYGKTCDRTLQARALRDMKDLVASFAPGPPLEPALMQYFTVAGLVAPKDVMFVLDASESMVPRVHTALQNIVQIYDNNIGPNDRVGVYRFNEYVYPDLPLQIKDPGPVPTGPQYDAKGRPIPRPRTALETRNMILSLSKTEGCTSFYRSLVQAMESLDPESASAGPRTPGPQGKDPRAKFLIALTDGDDNDREQRKFLEMLKSRLPNFHGSLVIIGIGRLLYEPTIRQLCSLVQSNPEDKRIGLYINVDSDIANLAEAFGQAAQLISSSSAILENFDFS